MKSLLKTIHEIYFECRQFLNIAFLNYYWLTSTNLRRKALNKDWSALLPILSFHFILNECSDKHKYENTTEVVDINLCEKNTHFLKDSYDTPFSYWIFQSFNRFHLYVSKLLIWKTNVYLNNIDIYCTIPEIHALY